MVLSLTGFLVAAWFLSRAYVMTLFLLGGFTEVVFQMAMERKMIGSRLPLPRTLAYSGVLAISLVLVMYILLRVVNLDAHVLIQAGFMKIAHVVDSMEIGGAEMLVTQMCRLQREQGHDPCVYAIAKLGELGEQLRKEGFVVQTHVGRHLPDASLELLQALQSVAAQRSSSA